MINILCVIYSDQRIKKLSTCGRRHSRMDVKSDSGLTLIQALVDTCDSPQELRKRDNEHRAELLDSQTVENHCSYSYYFAVSQETTIIVLSVNSLDYTSGPSAVLCLLQKQFSSVL